MREKFQKMLSGGGQLDSVEENQVMQRLIQENQ